MPSGVYERVKKIPRRPGWTNNGSFKKGEHRSIQTEFKKGVRGSNTIGWKGGRHISKRGYAYLYMPYHPNKVMAKYFPEHRFIMEQHLGRLLLKEERVHHINGNKLDNRIENLKLCSGISEHAKIHIKDRVRKGVQGFVD